jgi:hypothetical protein
MTLDYPNRSYFISSKMDADNRTQDKHFLWFLEFFPICVFTLYSPFTYIIFPQDK